MDTTADLAFSDSQGIEDSPRESEPLRVALDSENLGCGGEYSRIGVVRAVLVGIGDTNRARWPHEELSRRHPRIVDERAFDGAPSFQEFQPDIL